MENPMVTSPATGIIRDFGKILIKMINIHKINLSFLFYGGEMTEDRAMENF